MAALADALPEVLGGRRLVAVVSILDDKDAAAMLRALLPLCDEVVFTRARNPRALPPATLQSLAASSAAPPARSSPTRARRSRAPRELAGADGVVLATGSIYLIADLLAARRARARPTL